MANHLALDWMITVLVLVTPSVFGGLFLYTDAESPQIGSTVKLKCYGPVLQQRGLSFFTNGGKLVWRADDDMIASSSVLESVFVHNVIASDGENKYSISETDQSSHAGYNVYFSLQIDNVSVDDNKAYTCALLAAHNAEEVTSGSVTLNVQFPPNQLHPLCSVDFIQSNSNSATLRCRSEKAFPPVRLNWTSSEGLLSNVKYSPSDGFIESDVDIQIIPFKDMEYTCVMTYAGNFEPTIRNCKVVTPKISLESTLQEILEGGDAVFTCSVSAEPEPTENVSWSSFPYLNSRNSTNDDSTSVSTLTISNVTVKDNGTQIICHSQNIIGESQRMTYLLVKTSEPLPKTIVSIEVKIDPQSIGVQVGDTAVIECLASINNASTKPEYRWYYEDQEISILQNSSEKFSIEQILFQRLFIRNVDMEEHNATISCVVSVDGVEAKAQSRLHVRHQNSVSPAVSHQSPTYLYNHCRADVPFSIEFVVLILTVTIFLLT